MYLLDTDVISELRKVRSGKANERVAAWFRVHRLPSLYISAITVFEIRLGILGRMRKDPTQAIVFQEWLDHVVRVDFASRILSVDTAVALRCAELHVPDPRSYRDSLIAATAFLHGLTVVTGNAKDFAPMGVPIVNPWD